MVILVTFCTRFIFVLFVRFSLCVLNLNFISNLKCITRNHVMRKQWMEVNKNLTTTKQGELVH